VCDHENLGRVPHSPRFASEPENILNSVYEKEEHWHTCLIISASLESFKLNFKNILFCVCPLIPLLVPENF
jgi:hypothetical protein